MKKIVTFTLISVFVILTILDIITSTYLYYKKNLGFTELNPIYILTGNFWLSMIVMKVLVLCIIFIFFFVIKKGNEFARYSIVVIFLIVILMLFTIVQVNYNLCKHPVEEHNKIIKYIKTEAKKQNITEEHFKINIYRKEVINPYFKTISIIFLIFLIFKRIEKENIPHPNNR